MSKWETHVQLTKIIRSHPGWTDDQVGEEARLHKLDMHLIAAARREVEGESHEVHNQSTRNY